MTNWIQHLDGRRTPIPPPPPRSKVQYLLRKAADHSRYVVTTGDGEATAWFVFEGGILSTMPWPPSRESLVISAMMMPIMIHGRDPFHYGLQDRARYLTRALAEAQLDDTMPRLSDLPDEAFEWTTSVERHRVLDPLLVAARKRSLAALVGLVNAGAVKDPAA